jgi:hypothetical protein
MPVLRSTRFDDSAAVPIWLQSKRGVYLTDDPCDEQQYELLLRALHKAPPPPVGPKPAFLTSDAVGLAPNAVSIPQATPTTKGDDRPQQSPIAYAWYEATGSNVPRIQVYV